MTPALTALRAQLHGLEHVLNTVMDSIRALEAKVLPEIPVVVSEEHEAVFYEHQSTPAIGSFMKQHGDAVS